MCSGLLNNSDKQSNALSHDSRLREVDLTAITLEITTEGPVEITAVTLQLEMTAIEHIAIITQCLQTDELAKSLIHASTCRSLTFFEFGHTHCNWDCCDPWKLAVCFTYTIMTFFPGF